MVIARISGGLGNQLFQYAAARSLADLHGAELKLDCACYTAEGEAREPMFAQFPRRFYLGEFALSAAIATPAEVDRLRDPYRHRSPWPRFVRLVRRVWPGFIATTTHRHEKNFRFDPTLCQVPPPVYLQGFWQSERYFKKIEPLLRKDLRWRNAALAHSAEATVARFRSLGGGGPIVSLHVRRGDLAHAHEVLKQPETTYGAPVTLDYIEQAMALFPSTATFLVFSDTPADRAWCREHIRSGSVVVPESVSELQDFATMSACDHHITANSTFSWWAAWLNPHPEKRVVTPRVWSSPWAKAQMPTDDLIPATWTQI